jgi:hypothetical protein
MNSANAATAEQIAQDERAAVLERTKRIREGQRAQGIIAVNAAERGVGSGGSVAALSRAALSDEGINVGIVNTNENARIQRSLSDLSATNIHLANQSANVLTSLIEGGLKGASTGLSIDRAIPHDTPELPGPPETGALDYDPALTPGVYIPDDTPRLPGMAPETDVA